MPRGNNVKNGCGGGIFRLRSVYFNLMGVVRESEGGGQREEAAKELFFFLSPRPGQAGQWRWAISPRALLNFLDSANERRKRL